MPEEAPGKMCWQWMIRQDAQDSPALSWTDHGEAECGGVKPGLTQTQSQIASTMPQTMDH